MRTRLLATIAALSLTLTACGGDQEPEADTPTPIQSSATPSPTPSDKPTPSGTEAQDPEKAEPLREFAARWLKANHAMQTTGDLTEYRKFVAKDCAPCKDLMSRVSSIYANGGSIEFEGSTVKKIGAPKVASGLTSFDLTYTAGTTRIKETAGAAESLLEGGDQLLSVTVRKSATGWRVVTFAKYNS